MKLVRVLAIGAALAAVLAPAVRADTVKLEVNNAEANWVWINYAPKGYSNTQVGGGSFDVSQIDDVNLDYLYCVDLNHTIAIPGTYAATVVDTTGIVNGAAVANADKVAWLLTTYGGITGVSNQSALQAVIWETIYGDAFSLGAGNGTAFNTALTDLLADIAAKGGIKSGDVSQFRWLSPKVSAGDVFQGLVTSKQGGSGVVPEAGSLALLLPGLAPLGLALRRRRA